MTTAKVSYTLPKNLVALTEEIAREKRISRSKVVSACLQELADRRKLAEMEEGYKAMAETNRLLAEQFLPVVAETWPRWGASDNSEG